jgi:hypothetical protein
MKTIANVLNLAVASFHSAPHDEADRAGVTANYTADMLQRTTTPPEWPDRVDYLAVERIARELRSQYIESLLARAKKALATRFSRGAAKQVLSR